MSILNNKNVIVTGASGGIGNSIIEKLSENGANILASGTKIEKLEELKSKFNEIKICVGYEMQGKKINSFPNNLNEQLNLKPIYKVIPGWKESTYGIRSYSELPKNAKKYIEKIENLTECSVDIISTSPEREDTIILNTPF